ADDFVPTSGVGPAGVTFADAPVEKPVCPAGDLLGERSVHEHRSWTGLEVSGAERASRKKRYAEDVEELRTDSVRRDPKLIYGIEAVLAVGRRLDSTNNPPCTLPAGIDAVLVRGRHGADLLDELDRLS